MRAPPISEGMSASGEYVVIRALVHKDLVPVIKEKARKSGVDPLEKAGEYLQLGVESERMNKSNQGGR